MKHDTLLEVAEILGNGYKCYVKLADESVHTADTVSLEDQKSDAYQEFVPLEGEVTFGIMERYTASVSDFEKQSELIEALSFDQPFLNFKRKAYAIGLADEWLPYRAEAIAKILADRK